MKKREEGLGCGAFGGWGLGFKAKGLGFRFGVLWSRA